MTEYEEKIKHELHKWQVKMQKQPSRIDRFSKLFQDKINNIIPDKIHNVITVTIKQMTRMVLYGAEFTTSEPADFKSLEQTEKAVKARINFYNKTGAAEGGIIGAGGFCCLLPNFPS